MASAGTAGTVSLLIRIHVLPPIFSFVEMTEISKWHNHFVKGRADKMLLLAKKNTSHGVAVFCVSSTNNHSKSPGTYVEFDCIIDDPPPAGEFSFGKIEEAQLYKDVLSYSQRNFGKLKLATNPRFLEDMVDTMTLYGLCTYYWTPSYDKLLLHTLFHTWWFYLDDCLDIGVFKTPEDCKNVVDIVENFQGTKSSLEHIVTERSQVCGNK